ncbi:S-layer homology domain-containing protein [Paenibacillus sp. LMG 31461]|uniref:S-layer homology domain-containing protein n=1 Tax=Paenibacillus plantarum TaxID=2654975 RepID=A0ABX1XE55_9BACL|nr:S-layer homology domain-containing protein [Paenibacillus plantarum]NOU66772.1 S-layer homology domain-containing protein [Paenibacillus plantarum]
MKRLQTKLASILLIISLMISLMPAMTASAASTLVIKNLYTETDNAGTSLVKPKDNNLVTRITQLPFSLNVETTNVTDSQIPSIYFEITNINSGVVTTEKNNKAVIAGTNLVKFDNIQLTEGLNKVVVYLGDSNAIASAPGWLYYAPTTNLSDITVNNAQLEEGKIYPIDRGPLKAGTTGIQIKTKASNASAVQATITGDSLPKQGFKSNDGYFYFTGDDKNKSSSTCASVTSFCLNPGDNIISFIASNDTNKYQAVKKLWYDNGQPFAFNGKIQDTLATLPQKDLITIPTFQTSALTFTASVKSDLETATSLRYPFVDVAINGSLVATIDLSATDGSNTVALVTYSATTNTSLSRSNEYLVKDLKIAIPTITNVAANEQLLTFKFRDATNSLNPAITQYKFKYVDPSHPYIERSTISNGTIENELSLSDATLVNELPADIHVYANNQTLAIKALIDGVYYPNANPIVGTLDAATQLYKYDLKLQGITDGNKKLSIELYSDAGTTRYSTVDYKLNISNAPYVLVNNISNSMTIKNITNLACGGTQACISGRLVNFYQDPVTAPAVPVNKVEVSMNESVYTLDSRTAETIFGKVPSTPTTPGTLNTFTLPLNLFNADLTKVMVEGKNTLKFKIYVNNVFITEQSYDIYLFSTDAPQFTTIKPVESGTSGTQFIANSDPDTYTTTQRTVSFDGLYSSLNANGLASSIKALTLVVHTKDAKGDALVHQQTIGSSSSIVPIDQTLNSQIVTSNGVDYFTSISDTNFKTTAFKLLDDSDVVFEFRITNNSNITATKSITITRQNVPYTVVQPLLIKNPKGELQSNINSDFYNIIIEAENADSVLFDKNEATKRTVNSVDQYLYQVTNLKPGANQIKFTINRNGAKVNGSFILFNTNTNVQGAATLQNMNTKFKLFNNGLQLSFPKDTKLMRNVPDSNNNQYITTGRKILFGIADIDDGRVDKSLFPVPNGYYKSKISVKVVEDTFHPASNLYYMDAGFIPAPNSTTTTPDDLTKGLNGTGVDPYDTTNSGRAYFNRLNDEIVVPTQDGELTLQFDQAIRQEAGKYITVFFYDIYANYSNTTDYGWRNLGGVVDTKNNTITVPFRKFGYYQVMYMDRSFDDMTGHSFARNELETLYSKGLMRAKTTFSFGPNDYITRGEFAQVLVKIFKLPLNYAGSSTFSDVLKIDNAIGMLYDYKYVETAARAGIIRGQASNRFNPGGSITRQDAAVMIARAAEMKMSTDLNKSLISLQKSFTDGDRIESYSRPAVEAVSKAGLIEGIPNTLLPGEKKETVRFDPTELLTRAQASIIGYRVMKQQKMVP